MQGKEEEELFYEQKQRDDVGLKTWHEKANLFPKYISPIFKGNIE